MGLLCIGAGIGLRCFWNLRLLRCCVLVELAILVYLYGILSKIFNEEGVLALCVA